MGRSADIETEAGSEPVSTAGRWNDYYRDLGVPEEDLGGGEETWPR